MSINDDVIISNVTENRPVCNNKIPFTVINTNARSLCPKISSLIDCFSQMDAAIGIVSETWMSDGGDLEEEIENLKMGTGLNLVYRNREANERGFSHGGIAIVYKESVLALKKIPLHNPKKYEVLVAEGNIKGCSRKLVVVACYLPPSLGLGRQWTSSRGLLRTRKGSTMIPC